MENDNVPTAGSWLLTIIHVTDSRNATGYHVDVADVTAFEIIASQTLVTTTLTHITTKSDEVAGYSGEILGNTADLVTKRRVTIGNVTTVIPAKAVTIFAKHANRTVIGFNSIGKQAAVSTVNVLNGFGLALMRRDVSFGLLLADTQKGLHR